MTPTQNIKHLFFFLQVKTIKYTIFIFKNLLLFLMKINFEILLNFFPWVAFFPGHKICSRHFFQGSFFQQAFFHVKSFLAVINTFSYIQLRLSLQVANCTMLMLETNTEVSPS